MEKVTKIRTEFVSAWLASMARTVSIVSLSILIQKICQFVSHATLFGRKMSIWSFLASSSRFKQFEKLNISTLFRYGLRNC